LVVEPVRPEPHPQADDLQLARPAEADPPPRRLDNTTLRALVLGQICLHASMAGLRLALPLMMLRQGGWLGLPPEAAAGLLLGLFALAPVVLALPAGRWADRRGYHKPVRAAVGLAMLGGVLGCVGAWLGMGPGGAGGQGVDLAARGLHAVLVRPGAWGFALLQGLLLAASASLVGAACNLGLIAMQRTAGRLAAGTPAEGGPSAEAEAPARPNPAELRRVFSWLGLAPALANVVGPLLAGVLIDAIGFVGAALLLSLLPLGKAACARRVPPEIGAPASPSASQVPSEVADRASTPTAVALPPDPAPALAPTLGARLLHRLPRGWDLLGRPGIRQLLVVNWFFSTSWDLHAFVVPLLGHERGLSASAIGTVLGVFAAAVAGVRVLIPLVAERVQERQVLGGAMLTIAAVFFVYPWAHSLAQMAALALLLGLSMGSAQPMVMTALHHLAPPERQGEALAMRSAAINLSSALLPSVFGLVGAALGASLLFRGMSALLLLLGLPLAWRLGQDAHRS
jgi:MFS family permease